jgi:hypothetical protein
LPKNGPGHVDRIVESKFLDYVDRRVVTGCELICESNARRYFNFFREPSYDFAESPDLLFGISADN